MLGIDFPEFLVIGLVALLVLGPKRMPEVARTAGRWIARLRRYIADVKHDIDRELRNADMPELAKLQEELNQARHELHETSAQLIHSATLSAEANTSTVPTIAPPPVADNP